MVSMPITPAPTTTIHDGTLSEDLGGIDNRFPVELDRRRPRRLGADADDELVAMDPGAGALIVDEADGVASTNLAVPTSIATWLRVSRFRMTSISRLTTCAIRDETSEMVMSCLTRYAWPYSSR
jgi:hypothetical protein